MPQINLLPWREQARKAKKVRFTLMLGLSALFAVLVIIRLHGHYDTLIDNQQGRNTFITQKLGSAQGELNALNVAKKQQELLVEKLEFIIGLRENDYKAVELLNYLTQVVPEAVNFTKVTRVGNQVTLIGRAKSNLQITQLMKNIEAVTIFQQPELSLISSKENSTGEERVFQLLFVQKQ